MIDELKALEAAEERYLLARHWYVKDGLWHHPSNRHHGHIGRVAAYKQRQQDAVAENAKEAARAKP